MSTIFLQRRRPLWQRALGVIWPPWRKAKVTARVADLKVSPPGYLPASGRYRSTREAEAQRRANCADKICNDDC
jgi:hypothetical protein